MRPYQEVCVFRCPYGLEIKETISENLVAGLGDTMPRRPWLHRVLLLTLFIFLSA